MADLAPRSGDFDPEYWLIIIDSQILRAGPLTPEQETHLVQALYHELRHVEQYYAMTCWCIDTGQELSLNRLQVPRLLVWSARHMARPRLVGPRAKEVVAWWTQVNSPELQRQTRDYVAVAKGVQRAQAKAERLNRALRQAEQRKASRNERKKLSAALKQAMYETVVSMGGYKKVLKDYERLPLESDIRHVLRRLATC